MSPAGRDETPRERVDRNFQELMQEIRVAQTGVQVLFAFLLTLPFTSRFEKVAGGVKPLYFSALVLSAVSAVLLVAPTIQHRLLFRLDDKAYLLRRAHLLAIAGVAALGLAIVASLMVVTDVLYGVRTMYVVLVLGAIFILWIWVLVPIARRRVIAARRRARRAAVANLESEVSSRAPPPG